MPTALTVDDYIERAELWSDELARLRDILRSTGLDETIKWGAPCYTSGGKNIVGIAAFTSYVGLWFHQGAQLSDPEGVLINAQPGTTKAMRQWRFTSAKEIKTRAIKAYVKEAIAIETAGKAIKPDRAKPLVVPAELRDALATNAAAKAGFDALTKGKQREYADHISEAKRDATKLRRIEKILPLIAAGVGLHDKYRC